MLLTRDEVRAIDRRACEEYGLSTLILMENAGRGAADILVRLGVQGPVAICCGKGNNGGDGFVIARYLDNRGIPVRVFLFARPEELSGEAALNYQVLVRSGLSITPPDIGRLREELVRCDWVVDALFGTGLTSAVRPPFDTIIATINASGCRVFAVDIPSGLDCDTGLSPGAAVRAHHTATFVATKKGFEHPAAQEWLGQVHVVDIGAPRAVMPSSSRPTPTHP